MKSKKPVEPCRYLVVADLLSRWHISRPTLERGIRDGSLPKPVRLAGRRWILAEIEAYEAAIAADRGSCNPIAKPKPSSMDCGKDDAECQFIDCAECIHRTEEV
jgi:predicted DNA-binding transcriptional regulator AlpA